MNRKEFVFKLEYYFEDDHKNFLGNLQYFEKMFKESYLDNSFRCNVYVSEIYDFTNKTQWKNICGFEYNIHNILHPEGSILWSDKGDIEFCNKETILQNMFYIIMENINLYDGYITTKDSVFCGNWLYFVVEYKNSS